MNYLVGIKQTFLMKINDVNTIDIWEEDNLVRFIDKKKKTLFALNKSDLDFLSYWEEENEIPETLLKIYSITTETEDETTEEQSTSTQIEETNSEE